MADKKVLIAYYSHSGNTKSVAEKIQQLTGGDMFEIKPVKAYPANYNDVVNLAQTEKAQNFKPELIDNGDISAYDTIFVGTPVWWYTFSSPVRTFLVAHDFAGKTIMPFCTHGGGGASATYTDMQKLCPNATVKNGFTSFEDSAQLKDIEDWLK
ncbi:NAD(P)H-dependent oxidoreductase [bacterium]|nr:NAD(P)H-dependent oxidoreductase [bacterium]